LGIASFHLFLVIRDDISTAEVYSTESDGKLIMNGV